MFIYLPIDNEKLEWQKTSVHEYDEYRKKNPKRSIGLWSKSAEIHRLLLAQADCEWEESQNCTTTEGKDSR